jgi:superfamily II DNA or RNA helicase
MADPVDSGRCSGDVSDAKNRSECVSLLTQLSAHFDAATRQRGAAYFQDGRVLVLFASASAVAATVRGKDFYRVGLASEGRRIHASCTCPHFEVAFCKHLWAVLVAADARREFKAGSRDGRVELIRRDSPESAAGADVIDRYGLEEDLGAGDDVARGYRQRRRGRAMPPAAKVIPWPSRSIPVPRPLPTPPRSSQAPADSRPRSWRSQVAETHPAPSSGIAPVPEVWPASRELLYVIDAAGTLAGPRLRLEVFFHDLKKDGTWTKPKSRYLRRDFLHQLPDSGDRRILSFLAGATDLHGYRDYSYGEPGDPESGSPFESAMPFRYGLVDPQPELILPLLCETGRCRLRLRPEDDEPQWLPMAWDDGEPWQLHLEVRGAAQPGQYELVGALRRGAERMELNAPVMLVQAGLLFTKERVARYEHHGAFRWVASLRKYGSLVVPETERDEFLTEVLRQPNLPPLDLPEELRYEEATLVPRPRLTVKPDKNEWRRDFVQGELSFDYDGIVVAHDEPSRAVVKSTERRVLRRDSSAELAAERRLYQLGWRRGAPSYDDKKRRIELRASRLPNAVRDLVAEGWHVEAEGKVYRNPGHFDVQIRSGIDWFELHGTVQFGDTVAHLPELLAAARRGAGLVRLGDGTFGLLPHDWLKKYGSIAGFGTSHEDHVRFTRSQAGLLDALLASQPEAQCDTLFTQLREELRHFGGVHAAEPPAGFTGELRPYQKEGLGWLGFLRKFSFGGCLADDMGLGKTVQVLALLEERRELRERQDKGELAEQPGERSPGSVQSDLAQPGATRPRPIGPSLVVMPKSLIFNWKQEAARFAPRLRLLDHTGPLRQKGTRHFGESDVILTTYGTLRRDAVDFKDVHFDYVILDEAQAIKNGTSESAKAARLLRGDHRLALSGTPIENHLGELWSLFEFLNPGMLGSASIFKSIQPGARGTEEETRKLLAHALRPFLLRRTKDQVARDLPPKLEQTLYCELEDKQRKLYDELRDHYRQSLLKRVDSDGMGKAKIQILEALLRLRQAAIHPGLLDKRRTQDAAAKLDMLLPRLLEVIDEGHKVLVFSQFTGMLAILREHLERLQLSYEYLDGKTRDREARVERFQTDASCKLFLISLKAGGVGLNLTAAQYVFLLDPWWNPAVEAQAIDRAHRIGQTSRVFAYRLIARDTVEEKVLQLQSTKRELADAIVNADNALIRDLGREDLELLLS